MTDHICIPENLVAGGIELKESECPFCCKKTKQKAGYTGVLCLGCNSILSGDEWRGQIVKRRRELLGLTRPQMANLAGKSKHIIKHYEYVKCPDWYMTKTKELMEKQNGK